MEIPRQFGEYSTLLKSDGTPHTLGSGAFGTTVVAYRSRRVGSATIRDDFAIKLLRDRAIEDSQSRARFVAEILALRELQHENLVRYADCGEIYADAIYLVMELCRGGDLERIVKRLGPLSETSVLHVALQVCAGLREAHKKNYLHRDLKPSNILIADPLPEGANREWLDDALAHERIKLKIVDFGLAARLGSQSKGFAGSPMFASPEQIREGALDERCDLYSLGMTLWYLLTGRNPIITPGNTSKEVMRVHTSAEAHDAQLPAHISPALRGILSKLLKKSVGDRFATARDAGAAIEQELKKRSPQPQSPKVATVSRPRGGPTADRTWGTGSYVEHYTALEPIQRRPLSQLYKAKRISDGTVIALSAWESPYKPNDPIEAQLTKHLLRLKEVSELPDAPLSLVHIPEVRRTANEWCLVEEWIDGRRLEDLSTTHGRSMKLNAVFEVLHPLADACDFLQKQGINRALMNYESILISPPEAIRAREDWMQLPPDQWGLWRMGLSIFAVPEKLIGTSAGNDAWRADMGVGTDQSERDLSKAFARIVYRLIEGSEVAEFADHDESAYSKATRLTATSNQLLSETICGKGRLGTAELLTALCKAEGIFDRAPERTTRQSRTPDSLRSSAHDSKNRAVAKPPSSVSSTSVVHEPPPSPVPVVMNPPTPTPSPAPAPPPPPTPTPPVAIQNAVADDEPIIRIPDAGNRSARSREYAAEAPRSLIRLSPALTAMREKAQVQETAVLVPQKPGRVRSPYGDQLEQNIRGVDWKGGQRISCQQTSRYFLLPHDLDPMEATFIPGRFDVVLTPYTEPPQEARVPSGRWKPGEVFGCAITGRGLKMPLDLPSPAGVIDEDEEATVRSPFGNKAKVKVPATLWRPGQTLECPETHQFFLLPDELPALTAIPTERPGFFYSPYAQEKPFEVAPIDIQEGNLFECPRSKMRIQLPAFPDVWVFPAAGVRQGKCPQARSPYVKSEEESWQPVGADAWTPGGILKCVATGQRFQLPARLPALTVAPGERLPSFRSPFPPHPIIPVPMEMWAPGKEKTFEIHPGKPCEILLPTPPMGIQASAQSYRALIRSPHRASEWMDLPGKSWIPGARCQCKFTGADFWLPSELPPLETTAAVELAARSPYSEKAVPIPASQWKGGERIKCPETGLWFLLPPELPPPTGKVFRDKPGMVESPFAPGAAFQLEFAKWKPNAEITCPKSARVFKLPAEIPAWIVDAEIVVASRGLVRNPHSGTVTFRVPGAKWIAGEIVTCPQTGAQLQLPKNLEPLEASVSTNRPGFVTSPYDEESEEFRLPRGVWKPGGLITCPVTRRLMKLPDDLPEIPRRNLIWIPVVLVVVVVWIGIAIWFHKKTPTEPQPEKEKPTPVERARARTGSLRPSGLEPRHFAGIQRIQICDIHTESVYSRRCLTPVRTLPNRLIVI